MGNKKKNKGKAGGTVDRGDGAREKFHLVTQQTSDGSGKVAIAVSPLLNDPLSIQANSFEYYRFIKLRFRLMPYPNSTGGQVALQYYSGVPDATPASATAIANSDQSTWLASTMTVPSKWVNVPRTLLSGKQPWYKAVAGNPESVEEIQGYIIGVSSVFTNIVVVEIAGMIEFKGVTDSSATPPMSTALRESLVTALHKKVEEYQANKQRQMIERRRQAALAELALCSCPAIPTGGVPVVK